MATLLEVGFWRQTEGDRLDQRPHPRALQDPSWFAEHPALATRVISYLRTRGCVESYEMGYSFCRLGLDCAPKEMGACTMTDGVYCWPEGYAHYLQAHHVRPPQELVDHICNEPPDAPPRTQLWMWDHETNNAVPMPLDMQAMILAHTTITI
ncbi:hypothetical protein ACHHYP_05811 [Achlya hypogyna]|uniref:Uncharacterized protein n=1 Tax=Achlya hypogyna TaxID=1202772 RepID=A0A1V9YWU9_ACHHY|nr:hypothetical protein ACHHYP_05811 [Achlya hypogyna]